MRGIKGLNIHKFDKYAARLRQEGYRVFNPADIHRQFDTAEAIGFKSPPPVTMRKMFKEELTWILDEADALCLIPGWEKSEGSLIEKSVAEAIGIEVIYL